MDSYTIGALLGYYIALIVQVILALICLYLAHKKNQKIMQFLSIAMLVIVAFKTYWEDWNWFLPYILRWST